MSEARRDEITAGVQGEPQAGNRLARRRFVLGGLGGLGALSVSSLAACSSSAPSASASASRSDLYPKFGKQWSIYYATHAVVDGFWATVHKGAIEGAEAMNLKLSWTQDVTFSVETTIARMDAALAVHPDFLVFSAPDPTAQRPQFEKAVQEGIPVICVNTADPKFPGPGSLPYDCFIGGDDYESGEAAAMATLQPWNGLPAKPRRGGVMASSLGNISTTERNAGWESVYKSAGIPSQLYDISGPGGVSGGNPDYIFTSVKAALTVHPDLDAMLVVSGGDDTVAIEKLLQQEGLAGKIKLTSIDLTGNIVQDILAKTAIAVEDNGPYLQGYLPCVLARAYLDWGIMPTNQNWYTGPHTITDATAALALAGQNAGYR